MKTPNKIAAAAMAGLMATTSFSAIAAYAGSNDTTTTSATATTDATEAADASAAKAKADYVTQKDMLKTSDAAAAVVTQVRAARMALFDNQIDAAKKAVKDAQTALSDSEADLKALRVVDPQASDAKADYVPFDISMALSDTFKPTKENTAALDKAKDQMKSGDNNKAVETLRVASVDMDVSAALLPEDASAKTLDQAANLIDQKSYFDANLALKSIEDSIIVRSFGIDAIPAQGAAKAKAS